LLKESIARMKGEHVKRRPQVTLKLDFLRATVPDDVGAASPPRPTDASDPGRGGDAAPTPTIFEADTLARIPAAYIPDTRLRIQAYRKIAAVSELADVAALRAEFRDRYGKLPREVALLLQCAEVRILAAAAHVDIVETRDDKIMLSERGQLFQVGGKFPRLTSANAGGKLTEIKELVQSLNK
jgi:transcription-repair coupling factor (superfamily II helicase)